jgi:hypothetical protein
MKLFVAYIGGAHDKSLIELHDMRFVVGQKIEDTFEELRNSWWGVPNSLHLDAWGVLEYADGYDIHLSQEMVTNSKEKLYFINLGGYDQNQFTELHKNIFVVAESESKAKIKAIKQVLDWQSYHRDYQYEVENILDLTNLALTKNLHIHLKPSKEEKEFKFICKYFPIGQVKL